MTYSPGAVICDGKYRVEALIGRGAYGEVYRVAHLRLGVTRAVKVLRQDVATQQAEDYARYRQRFELEAHLGAVLDSPYIIKVHDCTECEGGLFLEMEFAPGGDLRGKGIFNLEDGLRLARQLCQGLQVLHEKDIVHRDLKPSNILFDARGRAKIADLGLAQTADDLSLRRESSSQAPPHPGTPAYMSPEQERSRLYLTPSSDIYSLGCVLFQAFTGRVYRNVAGTLLRQLRPDLPAWLEAVLSRMLLETPGKTTADDQDPSKRYWSALQLLHDLEQGEQGKHVPTPPAGKQKPPSLQFASSQITKGAPVIFCPNGHLVLDAARCNVCGWVRPPAVAGGKPAWGPLELNACLGGPGRSVFSRPGMAQGVLALPLGNGELVGLDLANGRQRWRFALEQGRMTRELVVDDPLSGEAPRRLLLSLADERPLEQKPDPARLLALDPGTGRLTSLWESRGQQLSAPCLAGELLLLRSSAGGDGLLALERGENPTVRWKHPLLSWWPLPLVVSEGVVVLGDGQTMRGEAYLRAFSLESGRPTWEPVRTSAMLSAPPACLNGILLFYDKSQIIALDLSRGRQIWRHEEGRLYAAPTAHKYAGADGLFFVVVRGRSESDQPGHYLLKALEPRRCEIVWQTDLPAKARPRGRLLVDEGLLFMGCDDGRVLAYDLSDQHLRWEYVLGSEEDPLRSELILVDGLLIAGTASGRLVALQATDIAAEPCDYEQYLRRGDLDSAAAALALCGQYVKAAEIYDRELGQPQRALLLYERAGEYQRAGELAFRLGDQPGMLARALQHFEKSGDVQHQAETLERLGDTLSAARLFDQLRLNHQQAGEQEEAIVDSRRAAQLFETAGKLREAMELYHYAGDQDNFLRLRVMVPYDLGDVEKLEQEGKLEEAGDAASKVGEWRRAADLYRRAGAVEKELGALVNLAPTGGVAWAWQRLTELARRLGRFDLEAQAWEQLGEELQAAQAYLKAARQAEQRTPDGYDQIAQFFAKAQDLFETQGMEVERQLCWSKVMFYRRLPWVVVQGGSSKAFREGEFNHLELQVRNIGHGVAQQVQILADTSRFEIDRDASTLIIRSLGINQTRTVELFLRPQPGEVGEAVPLVLKWSWKDQRGVVFSERSSTPVSVRSRHEPSTGGNPVQIIYQAPVYQTQDGDIVSGTKVEGDQFSGDKVGSGGQKGDRVEIQRGQGGALDLPGARSLCPNCDLPVQPEDAFCQGCGQPLPTAPAPKRKRR